MLGKLHSWYGQPFREDMSAGGWFALVGLVILSALVWKTVMKHMEDL